MIRLSTLKIQLCMQNLYKFWVGRCCPVAKWCMVAGRQSSLGASVQQQFDVYWILYELKFLRWFYFREFRESNPRENFHFNLCLFIVMTIVKLTTRELPHLAKTAKITVCENNGVYSSISLKASGCRSWIPPLQSEPALPIFYNQTTCISGLHTNFFSWWPDRATKIINNQFLVARTGNL